MSNGPYLQVHREVRRKIPRSLDISIEQSDIKHGVQCDSGECPTARATFRVAEPLGASNVVVGGERLHIYFNIPTPYNRETIATFLLPAELRAWIRNFDDYHPERGVPVSEVKPVMPIKARLVFRPFEFDEDYPEHIETDKDFLARVEEGEA